jgi:hypothetical protein
MKSFFGGLLLAVGILVAGVSGLCSLVLLVVGATEPSGLADILPIVLPVGGIPFAVGLGLFFLGRSMIRAAGLEAQEPPAGEQDGI